MYFTPHLELREIQFKALNDRKYLFKYTSPFYYHIDLQKKPKDLGWTVDIIKKPFDPPFQKNTEEIIAGLHKSNAHFYFAYHKNSKNLEKIGWLCVEHFSWNNTTRLWDIDIIEPYRHQGYGTELMNFVKKISIQRGSRAIILECQTSNYPAIKFYRNMGFKLGGFDSLAYSNEDIQRHEVRLEMVYQFPS
jgi:ribosomal protein S18 acetylase RimI-like enzyme